MNFEACIGIMILIPSIIIWIMILYKVNIYVDFEDMLTLFCIIVGVVSMFIFMILSCISKIINVIFGKNK